MFFEALVSYVQLRYVQKMPAGVQLYIEFNIFLCYVYLKKHEKDIICTTTEKQDRYQRLLEEVKTGRLAYGDARREVNRMLLLTMSLLQRNGGLT